jgi:hypothetical protein
MSSAPTALDRSSLGGPASLRKCKGTSAALPYACDSNPQSINSRVSNISGSPLLFAASFGYPNITPKTISANTQNAIQLKMNTSK